MRILSCSFTGLICLDKDNPRANLAEIIVAKHRNGPTHGGIELVFLNNLARFENAATVPHR